MISRFFKACLAVCVILWGGAQANAQGFAPNSPLFVFPLRSWQGGTALFLADERGGLAQAIPESANAVASVWSPDGKRILFVDAERKLKLYDVKTQKTHNVRGNVEPPLVWREDSMSFAGILYSPPTPKSAEKREMCRFDMGGYPMGRTPLGNLSVNAQHPLAWIPGTDEVAFLARDAQGENAYKTDSTALRRLSSSHDLRGMNPVGGFLLWARPSANPRYILLSVYRYNLTLSTVERLPFPDRVPAINPDPRHGPAAIHSAAFAPNGGRLVLAVVQGAAGSSEVAFYSIKIDGTDARLIHTIKGDPKRVAFAPIKWSPDSQRILLQEGADFYMMNALGGGKIRLVYPDN